MLFYILIVALDKTGINILQRDYCWNNWTKISWKRSYADWMRVHAFGNWTAKKNTSIFVPNQWKTIVRLARTKNPYVVVHLRFNQFFDLQKLITENFGSFKYNTDGKRVSWIKIKVLRVNNDRDNQVQIPFWRRPFYGNQCWTENKARGTSTQKYVLSPKYTERRAISIVKKADLMSLCNSRVLLFHPYTGHSTVQWQQIWSWKITYLYLIP